MTALACCYLNSCTSSSLARAGEVIAGLQLRKGVLQDMTEEGERAHLTFHVPTRGLIGYKGVFTSATRGEGLLNRAFLVCAGTCFLAACSAVLLPSGAMLVRSW